MPVYEKIGDVRERAVTMGKIADILQSRGELDEALRIRKEEQLPVYEKIGDIDSKALTLWKLAQIELGQKSLKRALEYLFESYAINIKLGRLDGICFVGLDIGRLLYSVGEKNKGRELLERSRAGFLKLDLVELAKEVEDLLLDAD